MSERKAEKIYKKFYGREPNSEYTVNLKSMQFLTELGKVEAIEYKAKKHSDRKKHIYRHVFKKKPLLLTNGEQLIIFGDFEIKAEGITG